MRARFRLKARPPEITLPLPNAVMMKFRSGTEAYYATRHFLCAYYYLAGYSIRRTHRALLKHGIDVSDVCVAGTIIQLKQEWETLAYRALLEKVLKVEGEK